MSDILPFVYKSLHGQSKIIFYKRLSPYQIGWDITLPPPSLSLTLHTCTHVYYTLPENKIYVHVHNITLHYFSLASVCATVYTHVHVYFQYCVSSALPCRCFILVAPLLSHTMYMYIIYNSVMVYENYMYMYNTCTCTCRSLSMG